MTTRYPQAFLMAAIVLSLLSTAEGRGPSVAVMPLAGSGQVEQEGLLYLTKGLGEKLRKAGVDVIPHKRVQQWVEQEELQEEPCLDDACLAEAGQVLGCTVLVAGSVDEADGIYTVSLKLFDRAKDAFEKEVSEITIGPLNNILDDTMNRLAQDLAKSVGPETTSDTATSEAVEAAVAEADKEDVEMVHEESEQVEETIPAESSAPSTTSGEPAERAAGVDTSEGNASAEEVPEEDESGLEEVELVAEAEPPSQDSSAAGQAPEGSREVEESIEPQPEEKSETKAAKAEVAGEEGAEEETAEAEAAEAEVAEAEVAEAEAAEAEAAEAEVAEAEVAEAEVAEAEAAEAEAAEAEAAEAEAAEAEVAEEEVAEEEVEKGDQASLYVSTSPSGASVSIDGKQIPDRTPVAVPSLEPGEHIIEAINGDRFADTTVVIHRDKTLRLELALAERKTSLEIATIPTGAEIYVNKVPGPRTRPTLVTPSGFVPVPAGEAKLTVWRVGYRDTTLVVPVTMGERNSVKVELTEAPGKMVAQQKVRRGRRRDLRLATYLIPASVVGMVGCAVLYGAAGNDYREAREARAFLEDAVLIDRNGTEYSDMVSRNENEVKSARAKSGVATGLLLVSGAVLSFGVVLVF